MLYDVVAALLFVCSSGLLFNDRFRANVGLVLVAGVIALVSTYYLTKQIVHDELQSLLANNGAAQQTSLAASPQTQPSDASSAGSVAPQPAPVSQDEAQSAVNDYLDAWRAGDVDKQANLLADDFEYSDQDKTQSRTDYLAQKRKLAALYGPSAGTQSSISVDATGFTYTPASGGMAVSYNQTYDNPHYHSVGTNTFTVRKIDGTVKIAHESFQRESYEAR